MCECGDTDRGRCPRCETAIESELDARDHPTDDAVVRAEARADAHTYGAAA